MVSSGSPSWPCCFATTPDSIAPTVRLTFLTGWMNETRSPFSIAGRALAISTWSSALPASADRPWSCTSVWYSGTSAPSDTWWKMRPKSRPRAFQCSMPALVSSRSARPISSSKVRMPSWAMISRASSATKKKKFTTCSGLPWNFLRSCGSCVATPTGQVFRWHLRIMMQPSATSGAVAKPNSSAPSSAPITTSRPVFIWPSACTRMRLRRPLSISVCCVSARPSSQGVPACLIDDHGEAPVPPSWPAITTWSALAFATPAATVPTPTSDTSLTEMSDTGFTFFRSWISCARSSIE
ncbi:hypothetical protein D3C72_1468110 [compost metagenome]